MMLASKRPFKLHLRRYLGGLLLLATAFTQGTALGPPTQEEYAWRNVAIGGGGLVSGLLFHPRQPGLLYARTDVGGAFRWDEPHHRWIPLNDALGRGDAELLGIVSFAVDSQDPQRLYLACGSYLPDWARPAAILWSGDQGANWQRVALPFKLGGNADGRTTGERLQVDPNSGNILYLGTNQAGLWQSTDRALTWRRLKDFPADSVTFVLIDPHGGNGSQPSKVLYAGANDQKGPALFRSVDAGATWSALPGQPSGMLVHHAALDPAGVLYLAYANGLGPNDTTQGEVWKYTPSSERWANISPISPDPTKRDTFSYAGLALDPRSPGTVLVSTLDRWTFGDEIFRSTDGGVTWRAVLANSSWDHSSAPYTKNLKPHWIGHIALNPFDPDHALFITGYGVWSTSHAQAVDHGETTSWIFTSHGLEETVIEQLISPPSGAPLLSAIGDISGFRHDGLNVSPASGAHQPAYGSNPGIDFAEQVPTKMVRTHWGPMRGALSLDGGATWRDFATTPPPAKANGPGMIAVSANGRRLVWLPKGSGPYSSDDDGASWTSSQADLVSPTDYRTIGPVADRANPEKFYIYDTITGRILVSTDGGQRFTVTVTLPSGGGMLRTEPGGDGRVWVPTPHGLYLSIDSGRHFTPLQNVREAHQVGFGRAAPEKDRPAIYLAGRVNDLEALFRSDDYGDTWVVISNPKQRFGYPKTITGDPRLHGRVYLGTGGRGILYGDPSRP